MHAPKAAALAALLVLAAAAPAGAQATAPRAEAAPRTNLSGEPGTLSDKLSDTKGVIRPTGDVDPDMRRAAPRTGTMPVIKPGSVAPGTAK